MWKNESKDVAPQRMTEALTAYEEAVKEFSTSATEFLQHIPLLTKAQDAYQRAILVSTQVRDILDKGDETLRNFMAQMQQAVNFQPDNAASDERKPEAVKVETIKASGEKADAARA
jgi:exonuclease VII small subunit